MKKLSKLEYNVILEDNGKIVEYNIFRHGGFQSSLEKLVNQYTKEYKTAAKTWTAEDYVKESETFNKNYKTQTFEEKLFSLLGYYFWSKCEYEVVITSWPAFVPVEEMQRLSDILNEKRPKYREYVNLEVGRKIDIYSQVCMNKRLFLNYVWENVKLDSSSRRK